MKQRNKLPSSKELFKLFEYRNGELYSKVKRGSRCMPGKKVGSKSLGYIVVNIDKVSFRRSRIIYKMFKLEEPDYLDHINGIRDDDRIENLQAITNKENILKAKVFSHNNSGVSGVGWMSHRNKWRARIKIDQKDIHLGCFDNIDEAIQARLEVLNKHLSNVSI